MKDRAFGWTWGCSSRLVACVSQQTYRENGKRLIVSADEKLTAFLEVEESRVMTLIEYGKRKPGGRFNCFGFEYRLDLF